LERGADGELRFSLPSGKLLPAVPPSLTTPDDAAAALRARNEEHGLQIHPRTAIPSWPGDRLDLGYAIDVLRPKPE